MKRRHLFFCVRNRYTFYFFIHDKRDIFVFLVFPFFWSKMSKNSFLLVCCWREKKREMEENLSSMPRQKNEKPTPKTHHERTFKGARAQEREREPRVSDIISITESNKEDDDASIDDCNQRASSSAVCASSRVVVDEFLLGGPIVSFIFACLCECIFADFLSRGNRGSRKGRARSMDKQRLECTSRVYFFKDIIF